VHHVDILLYDVRFSSSPHVVVLKVFVKVIIILLKTLLYGKSTYVNDE